MQASALLLRPETERVTMVTDAGIRAGWLKRLKMFVLRSRVQISEGNAQVWGLAGTAASLALGDAALAPAWSSQPHAGGQLVRLPDVQGVPRWLWLGASDAAGWLAAMPALAGDAWSSLEVLSGIPRVTEPTFDQFVPQMVNFELVGGVNFQKGCYPGQEVVARSQYRGTVKRRAHLAAVAGAARPGQALFAQDDPSQPAGMVILSAPMPADLALELGAATHLILAELKIAAASAGVVLGGDQGPVLRPLPLPYALPSPDGDA
jgi:folate-binding protein YgfZ